MIRIGVLGTSGIAERRMIPAILKEPSFRFVGVAFSTREEMGFGGTEEAFAPFLSRKLEKAERFGRNFGGKTYAGYTSMLEDPEVDAVYIALPPALHALWIRRALEWGKHVLAEKPFTTREQDCRDLIGLARDQGLAVLENYGFCEHRQMQVIRQWMEQGEIGDLRLVRATFGFPHRESSDFRYNRALGGGALLDCGGYTLKAATALLGPDLEVTAARCVVTGGHEVDVFGSATLQRADGLAAQLAWGMDQSYRCELELWGSRGMITAPRFFTAPDGFPAPVRRIRGQETAEETAADDQFQRMVIRFAECIQTKEIRNRTLDEILLQGKLTERVRTIGG